LNQHDEVVTRTIGRETDVRSTKACLDIRAIAGVYACPERIVFGRDKPKVTIVERCPEPH
jgi:hypothetical protein